MFRDALSVNTEKFCNSIQEILVRVHFFPVASFINVGLTGFSFSKSACRSFG